MLSLLTLWGMAVPVPSRYLTVDHSDLAAGTSPPSGSRSPGGLAVCERVKLFGDGSLGAGDLLRVRVEIMGLITIGTG